MRIGRQEGRVRAQVLGLAQRHAGRDSERDRLLRRGDDVIVPVADHHRRPHEISALGKLQVLGQTTADEHSVSITTTSPRSGVGLMTAPIG